MKIAHLTTVDMSLRYLVLPQLEAAAEAGEAIAISAPGPYVAEIEQRGITHFPLSHSTRGMNPLSDLGAAYQLWKILRREGVDILHTHNPKPGVYGRIVGRLAGVPIVVNTVHGLYATETSSRLKRWIVYGLEWFAAKFSDSELIQNPEDLDLLAGKRIVPRSKLRLLGNGVDLTRFSPESADSHRDETRRELGLGPDDIVVGMIGRLVEEKGVPELLDAFAKMPENYRLVIAGPDDPEKSDALPREMIRGAEERGVQFLGMRSDVERLYGAFDMFVLPSHREGFPRAAMEAAASGLPLIATNIRGCRQVVSDGVNGRLVPVSDAVALEAAILELGSSESLRATMAAKSLEIARSDFDERDVVRIVMDTYESVASDKGLRWALPVGSSDVSVRIADVSDVAAVAEMHTRLINTGFLATLGSGFLKVLYEELINDEDSVVYVAVGGDGRLGFIAGTKDTGALYKRFLRSRAFSAGLRVVPALGRRGTIKRIVETLRYGDEAPRAKAELLSMGVTPQSQGKGVGSLLINQLLRWSESESVPTMKVVVGSENDRAIRLYNRNGFVDGRTIEVHEGDSSEEFIWSA